MWSNQSRQRLAALEARLAALENPIANTPQSAEARLEDLERRIGALLPADAADFNPRVDQALRDLASRLTGNHPQTSYFNERLRTYELATLNIKQLGYELARRLAGSNQAREVTSAPPTLLKSSLCRQADIESDWFLFWCREMCCAPIYHRKVWELAYICQVLYSLGKLVPGVSGLGFGCGAEVLPSVFVKYGASILGTDLDASAPTATAWRDTGQHADSAEKLRYRHICTDEALLSNIRFHPLDMNAIPRDLDGKFDFCWSSCALEHLGSIAQGLDFIENSLATLKPGGVAVHTTEFNLQDGETIDDWMTVLFQKHHFTAFVERLTARGFTVAPLDFDTGTGVLDGFVDIPPWGKEAPSYAASFMAPHLKLCVDGFACTSIGIIVQAPTVSTGGSASEHALQTAPVASARPLQTTSSESNEMDFLSGVFKGSRSDPNEKNGGDRLARIEAQLVQANARLDSLARIEEQLARSSAQVEFLKTHRATYLGDGVALTHLADETPIFINSNDYGSPINFLSGGRYEDDNLAVLLSFVEHDTVFVDVGANLGFFSLRIAQRLRGGSGKVLAFEPQARVASLLHHTMHINGLRQQVKLYRVALSDHAGIADFEVPVDHLGGGHVVTDPTWVHPDGATEWRKMELHVFDDIVPADFVCDLVKIDVEGYELEVLRGMRGALARSPKVSVLFEKMVRNNGNERGIWMLFEQLGFRLYGVGEAATLVPLTTPETLLGWDRGYALATRDADVLLHPDRRRFRLSPRQLNLGGTARFTDESRHATVDIDSSEVLSFGPYWSLPPGRWRLQIDGHADQPIEVIITERVGQMEIARQRLLPGENMVEFHCDHDLVKFECVLHAIDGRPTRLHLKALRFERIDGAITPPTPEAVAAEASAGLAPSLVIPLPDVPPRADDARYVSKQSLPRITVFSNCQGEVVASALQAFTSGRMPTIQAVTPLAVEKPELLVEPLREIALHHDLILMQPMVARLVLPLVPELESRIQLFPSVCFAAFHPDLCYVYRQWRSETLDGPLGPYHSSIAYHAWRVGMSVQQTLDHYRDDVYEALHFHDYWEASARALCDEGRAANLPLEGLLDRWRAQGCFMHSHNHPRKQVLIDITRALLKRMGMEAPEVDLAGFLHDTLASDRVWPVYPEIAARLGVPGSYTFKTTNGNQQVRTPIRLLDLEAFVERSFEAYETAERGTLSSDRPFSARYESVFGEAARQRGRVVVADRLQAAREHPYSDLPSSQFWRSAVAERSVAEVDPVSPRFSFEPSTRIATAGSCFAQNISRALLRRDCGYLISEPAPADLNPADVTSRHYGVYSARYGNLYTARQLLQLLQRATGAFVPTEPAWARPDGRWADPFRPTIEPQGFADVAALEADRSRHLAAVRTMFETLDVFVFTLGLTEAWISTVDGAVFPLAPGVAAGTYDPLRHAFVNFGVAEVVADLEAFVDALSAINPAARVLLTVSPVPLVATYEDRHVLTATTQSKAVLRAAADAVCRSRPQCDYFPAYEIVSGHHTRGAYYASDLRSVTRSGVDQVMALFFRHYLPAAPAPAPDPELLAEVAILGRLVCDEEQLDQPPA